MPKYPAISFSQYESASNDDALILFAAPAKAIATWAGIPRKGWHVRMLYQRWITQSRQVELKEFWKRASMPENGDKKYILGPTALTIAIHGEPDVQNDKIALDYKSPIDLSKSVSENLTVIAGMTLTALRQRLSASQGQQLDEFLANPLQEIPDTERDYVLESAMQVAQMERDANWFIEKHSLSEDQARDIVTALESISRPAVVVDGQHRLYGAAATENPIWLPVVAIPRCPWPEQIYQFVVINEKAKPIEASLLTDIFGSSLTPQEQQSLRSKLERSKVDVEPRIAAVIASREADSPFAGMVKFQLQGPPPTGTPFLPESAIRLLIDGGRGARGWRNDDTFYDEYVKPTFPDRAEWDTWTTGRWREYWFAFWTTIRDYYNTQAQKQKDDKAFLLWNTNSQSNLTKSVTLRLLQTLFIKEAVARIVPVKRTREVLEKALGPQKADEEVKTQTQALAIPNTTDGFKKSVQEWFLDKGVPVRFFLKAWKPSLDDAQGTSALQEEMERAFRFTQEDKRYHTRNPEVFSADSKD